MNIILQERDYVILQSITKYRFLLGRQIKILASFSGQRACDRRLKKLTDVGYIEKKHIIYGIPYLYFVTPKGKKIFNLEFLTRNVRIENIMHDINVIDTSIYFMKSYNMPSTDIASEREIKHTDGFNKKIHRPDLVINLNDETICIEIELSVKQFAKLEKNVKDNFITYDKQIWIVRKDSNKILDNLKKLERGYPNIEVIPLEKIQEFIKSL